MYLKTWTQTRSLLLRPGEGKRWRLWKWGSNGLVSSRLVSLSPPLRYFLLGSSLPFHMELGHNPSPLFPPCDWRWCNAGAGRDWMRRQVTDEASLTERLVSGTSFPTTQSPKCLDYLLKIHATCFRKPGQMSPDCTSAAPLVSFSHRIRSEDWSWKKSLHIRISLLIFFFFFLNAPPVSFKMKSLTFCRSPNISWGFFPLFSHLTRCTDPNASKCHFVLKFHQLIMFNALTQHQEQTNTVRKKSNEQTRTLFILS